MNGPGTTGGDAPPPAELPSTPRARIFLSAGEPSGDLHGANLIRALRAIHPDVHCAGFGGEQMAAAGCELLADFCKHSLVGFVRIFKHLRNFSRLLGEAERRLREDRPDAVVLIDFPGFNWWLARRARALGIPVVYFVPPQIWAWANWRVRKVRRWVDHVLCALPFERAWYEARGVRAEYIGHPYFDMLGQQRLDEKFVASERARPGTVIGILPGSRGQELENNLGMQLRAAELIHRGRPDTRFLIACLREDQAEYARAKVRGFAKLPVEVHAGRMAEVLHLAHSCVAVSGSVSLELLYHAKPAVIHYRTNRLLLTAYHLLRTCRHVSLVNLLAGREIFPEFVSAVCAAERIARHVLCWLNNPPVHERLRGELGELRDRVGEPGACARAAARILEVAAARPLAA